MNAREVSEELVKATQSEEKARVLAHLCYLEHQVELARKNLALAKGEAYLGVAPKLSEMCGAQSVLTKQEECSTESMNQFAAQEMKLMLDALRQEVGKILKGYENDLEALRAGLGFAKVCEGRVVRLSDGKAFAASGC